MSDTVSLTPAAARIRALLRDHEIRADRMRRRATHFEALASRSAAGSNQRRKLEARAAYLRAIAAQAASEISAMSKRMQDGEPTVAQEANLEKLADAGSRRVERAR